MSGNKTNTSFYQGIDFSLLFLPRLPPPTPESITWSVCLGLVGIATLVANSFTIAVFAQRKLRRPPHYLLISLACADIMVGSISVPIYICTMLNAVKVTLKTRAVFWFFDFLSGMASIFTLAAVSLERLFAIGWPLRHRVTSPQTYVALVAIPWILAVMVASLPLFDMFRLLPQGLMFTVVTISYCFPVVLTTLTYTILWFRVRNSDVTGAERNREKDKRLAATLAIATIVFVFTWLPYPVMLSIVNLCFTCVNFRLLSNLSVVSKFLHLSNSFMNSIVYILRISEFRASILELVCRKRAVRRVGVMPRDDVMSKSKSSEKTFFAGSQCHEVNVNENFPSAEG